ncbi:carbohydrate ABC transporter substrate-binding protein (CUT1 family) [Nocardia tenerifensis]|uniref:Probable sugar-binding periplasmic protein n=1 Tax=Nocardia tenerifensis TaxID=228006 RepID=A0A318JRZ1_9NOCA|nr:ABC transporter substrate-binding protein [Nocardia tenerifensis]PXX58752.1 carbohydrate ABC transporter substrate-binding protein (CUT1 family) [Nocardia tenerifensis]
MRRTTRRTLAALTACATALFVAACTGQSSGGGDDGSDAGKDVTITFWHGWSQDSEVKAIDANIAAFEKLHPNIHVKSVPNIADDKLEQALRGGGRDAPDVVSSFTTDNVGKFCAAGVWADLAPFLKKDNIDPVATFPAAMRQYSQFEGNQCALPLLSDSYGLFYNKTAFAAAGITSPPKTLSEFEAAARKLTIPEGDSFKQLGFMPNYHGYETTAMHYLGQFGADYFGADGKSNVATDPRVAAMFAWQKDLIAKLGGFDKLEKYRTTFGEEFSAKNPFHTGQVAMSFDGEWRTASLAEDPVSFEWATAPFPVPDDQADTYGRGYQTGTIVGIAKSSQKQTAAWQLVKYLATDTDAVVSFANAIHNVPSTNAALNSPKLSADPNFKTFIDIAKNPHSGTTPSSINGGAYQISLRNFGYDYEAGKVDLAAGLAATAKEIDEAIVQAK